MFDLHGVLTSFALVDKIKDREIFHKIPDLLFLLSGRLATLILMKWWSAAAPYPESKCVLVLTWRTQMNNYTISLLWLDVKLRNVFSWPRWFIILQKCTWKALRKQSCMDQWNRLAGCQIASVVSDSLKPCNGNLLQYSRLENSMDGGAW